MRKICLAALLIPALAMAAGKQPINPEHSQIAFTVSFAKHLRGFHSFEDLQKAAHAPGRVKGNGGPGTTIHWISMAGNTSFMMAEENERGVIGVDIETDNDVEIALDSNGAWDCEPEEACAPIKNHVL